MHKIHQLSNELFIAYNEHKSKKNLPTIIFLHGLFSSMDSSKALFLQDFCEKKDFPFIRFNALGHENSSGKFTDQSIDSWFHSAKEFISTLSPHGAILIGSSMGGWVSLLLAVHLPNIVKAVIGISPAPDFTEDMYKMITDDARSILDKNGIITLNVGPYTYNISHILIKESRKHLMLHLDKISLTCPIHILHGTNDKEVPYIKSLALIEKISSDDALCTLVKNGNHSLSRPEDLELLADVVEKMVEFSIKNIAKKSLK